MLIKSIITKYNSMLQADIPKYWQHIILAVILMVILTIRLNQIEYPALDRTHWKEIDYITISENYANNGFNFFKPQISWPAEKPNVTAMELPIVPYMAGLLYPVWGVNPFTVRFLTLFSSLLLIIVIFKITKLEIGTIAALFAALAAGLLPLNHAFNKYLFSEPTLILLSVLAVYFTDKWSSSNNNKDWWLSLASFSLAVSLKPTALYLLLPILWIYYRKFKFSFGSYLKVIRFILLAMILPVMWYSYAYYLTKNYIDVFGIFQGHNKLQTITMLSDLHWYKIMYGRVFNDILGNAFGTALFALGFLSLFFTKKGKVFYFYLSAIVIFFMIVAEGNIDAPYRQLTIIPVLSVFVASGGVMLSVMIIVLIEKLNLHVKIRHAQFTAFVLSFLCVFAISFSSIFYNKKNIYNSPVHTDTWELAKEVKKYIKPNSYLVAAGEYSIHVGGYDLSPVLYYYAGVKGWTLTKNNWNIKYLDSLHAKGAQLFAAYRMYREPSSDHFINQLKSKYELLYEDKKKSLLLLNLDQNAITFAAKKNSHP